MTPEELAKEIDKMIAANNGNKLTTNFLAQSLLDKYDIKEKGVIVAPAPEYTRCPGCGNIAEESGDEYCEKCGFNLYPHGRRTSWTTTIFQKVP